MWVTVIDCEALVRTTGIVELAVIVTLGKSEVTLKNKILLVVFAAKLKDETAETPFAQSAAVV